MGLGIYSWFGYELPLERAWALAREAGLDTVSLWWGEYDGGMPLRRQPEEARRLGLTVENAHAPFDGCNELWLPGEAGERYADGLIDALRGCRDTGVPVLVAHLEDGPNPPPPSPLGLERLRRVEEAAEETGVVLALENLRFTDHLHAALAALHSPRVGFCYDSGHHYLSGPQEDLLGRYGSRLAALHLHDNDGTGDWHALPFDGSIDWRTLAARLAATGYAGALSLEVQAYERYEGRIGPQEFLAQARAALERIRQYQEECSVMAGLQPNPAVESFRQKLK